MKLEPEYKYMPRYFNLSTHCKGAPLMLRYTLFDKTLEPIMIELDLVLLKAMPS
jgi:hypothetical protein